MHLDPESNLISLAIARGKIDHVIELGNFLIHVNKNNTPLLIEILDGGRFLAQLNRVPKENLAGSIMPVDG